MSEIVSKYKTTTRDGLNQQFPALSDRLREKGWTIRDAAEFLGVSRQRLYSVIADRDRIRLWECAVSGIPVCTPQIAIALKEQRKRKTKPIPKPKIVVPGIEVGDCVVAMTYAGIAEEGDEGWIEGIQGQKESLRLLVTMPGGKDWFEVNEFDDLFMTNGKSKTPGI